MWYRHALPPAALPSGALVGVSVHRWHPACSRTPEGDRPRPRAGGLLLDPPWADTLSERCDTLPVRFAPLCDPSGREGAEARVDAWLARLLASGDSPEAQAALDAMPDLGARGAEIARAPGPPRTAPATSRDAPEPSSPGRGQTPQERRQPSARPPRIPARSSHSSPPWSSVDWARPRPTGTSPSSNRGSLPPGIPSSWTTRGASRGVRPTARIRGRDSEGPDPPWRALSHTGSLTGGTGDRKRDPVALCLHLTPRGVAAARRR